MIRLASVIDTFKADFLAQYHHKLSSDHLRALSALTRCRTQASLKMQVQCQGCDHQVLMPHSCGHRHCPHCQHHESEQWLKRQIGRLVPAEYLLLTFTLLAELWALAYAHQNIAYDFLMRASWEPSTPRASVGGPSAVATNRASCSATRRWPRSFARRCWLVSRRPDCRFRRAIRKRG